MVFAAGRVLDGRCLTLPFAAAGRHYTARALYTGGGSEAAFAGEELQLLGLPLPQVRGDLPGYLCWLKAD